MCGQEGGEGTLLEAKYPIRSHCPNVIIHIRVLLKKIARRFLFLVSSRIIKRLVENVHRG